MCIAGIAVTSRDIVDVGDDGVVVHDLISAEEAANDAAIALLD